ncbi:MAG: hypothetical protein ACHQ51_02960 [Elusimicrobiota bacterium]
MNGKDEGLTDYLDGRLSPAEKEAFESRLAGDPALSRRLRLARALRDSLRSTAPRMPADLKAALKRRARAGAEPARSAWRDRVREAFGSLPLGCGLGAAFAAAALVLAVRLASSPREGPPPAARTREVAARLAEVSADLWSDDDGSDRED